MKTILSTKGFPNTLRRPLDLASSGSSTVSNATPGFKMRLCQSLRADAAQRRWGEADGIFNAD